MNSRNKISPHHFRRLGWRWWICMHCYEPRRAHPTEAWVVARPDGDTRRSAEEGAGK